MWKQLKEIFKMPFYAVRRGRNPGIYHDWDSCKSQVDKFPKARYKKFNTQQEAEEFVNGGDSTSCNNNTTSYSRGTAYSGVTTSSSYINSNGATYSTHNNSATNHSTASTSYSPSSLKQQVEHLSAMVHQLSDQINSYERSHAHGSKRSYSTKQNGGPGQSKRFKTDSSSRSKGATFVDHSDAVIVYTDGACFGNGRTGATAGIGVYWGDSHPDNVCERLPGRQTNNRAEIHAAVKAIQQAKSKGISNLVLKTDSQFCINGITNWIHNWKRNGWKLSTGQPVVNRADFEELEKNLQGINVQWVHVRGHRGEHGNEAADRLANEGAVKPHRK